MNREIRCNQSDLRVESNKKRKIRQNNMEMTKKNIKFTASDEMKKRNVIFMKIENVMKTMRK